MKALFFKGPGNIVVADVEKPRVERPDDVLVKIKVAGLCGSDLHFLREGKTSEYIQGHEAAGVVEQVGSNVAEYEPGDRVSIYHKRGCGTCKFCGKGYYNQCSNKEGKPVRSIGVDAEYYVCEKKYLLKLPDELSFFDGALVACGAGTAYAALKRMDLSGDVTLLIFGLGPLGLIAGRIAKAYGTKIIGVEVNRERLEMAKRTGFDHVIDGNDEGWKDELRKIEPFGIDCVMDFSGSRQARADAVQLVEPNGKVAFVGMRNNLNTIFDIDNMIRKQITIVGSYVYPITLWEEMKAFFVKHGISFDDLTTRTYTIDEAPLAYKEFQEGMAGKSYFVFD
jgi:threonine dehydrogenase-like Zn-dependent dehydrogenase